VVDGWWQERSYFIHSATFQMANGDWMIVGEGEGAWMDGKGRNLRRHMVSTFLAWLGNFPT